jgi:predicted TIM-barrel fold metal-dependent hydrolase
MDDLRGLLVSGERLKGELVIDFHTHIGPFRNYIPDSGSDGLVRSMDRLGIALSITAPILATGPDTEAGNQLALEAQGAHPNRIRAYVTVNPRWEKERTRRELERYYSGEGFAGIKLHPGMHAQPLTGPGYAPAFEFAREHGAVVLSHGWAGDANCDPQTFLSVAQRYPEVKLIMGHSAGTVEGNAEAAEAAGQADNLYLDLTGSIKGYGMLERMVGQVGAERILFGTDSTFIEPSGTLGLVLGARISDEEKRQMLGGNARRVFGERIEPYLPRGSE